MHCFLSQDNFFSILLLCVVLLPQIWYDNYVTVLATPERCSQGLIQTALFFLPQFGTRDSRYAERVQRASRRYSASETMFLFPWPNFAAFRPQLLSLGRISKLFHFFQRREESWSMAGARIAPFNSWGARRNARCISPGHLTVKVTESWNLFWVKWIFNHLLDRDRDLEVGHAVFVGWIAWLLHFTGEENKVEKGF